MTSTRIMIDGNDDSLPLRSSQLVANLDDVFNPLDLYDDGSDGHLSRALQLLMPLLLLTLS